ncbi:DUF4139 domain-containing protein [candidate division KSB1 bacterium]|nr:DUF4139 domain-containing protein [candidate division KSB1 bacterium]
MNKIFMLFYFVAAVGILSAEVKNNISHVTVYPTMAMVQREAEVALKKGENQLEIAHLTPLLVDESVFVKLIDTEGAQLEEVNVERWFLEKPEEGVVKSLEDQITEVEKQDKQMENEIKALLSQEKFLTSIQAEMGEKASQQVALGRISPTQWSTTFNFIGDNLNKVYASISELEFKRGELKSQKEALQKRLLQVKTAKPKEEKSINLTVKADSKSTARIVVAYLVSGVRWWASYDIRALPQDGQVEVVYSGHVRQKTGEDWSEVALALSTAQPARGARAPELRPWDLRIWEPRPVQYRKTEAAPMAMKVAEAGVADEEMAVAAPPPSVAEVKGVSVVFNISGARDVPSSEEDTKVLIMRRQFGAEMSYLTVPKLSPFAYLRGKFSNESEYPLLAGQAMIYVDGDFVGRTHFENLAPAEEVDLSLGIDDGIKVKRELVKKFERDKGFLTKKTEMAYIYKITMENFKPKEVTLQVKDQLPRPLHASITVEDIEFSHQPNEWDQSKNELNWQMPLKPQEKLEIIMNFTVTYPRDAHVSGLE